MCQLFLFKEKFNSKDFYMKIVMYVHFCHTKKYSQKNLKKCPILQTSENGLTFQYARKNPFFDQMTCSPWSTLFSLKNKIKFKS